MTPSERRDSSLPPRAKELRGKVFGDLTVIGLGPKDKYGHVHWICFCSCGQTKTIRSGNLLAGSSKSCGCKQKSAQTRLWAQVKDKAKP